MPSSTYFLHSWNLYLYTAYCKKKNQHTKSSTDIIGKHTNCSKVHFHDSWYIDWAYTNEKIIYCLFLQSQVNVMAYKLSKNSNENTA